MATLLEQSALTGEREVESPRWFEAGNAPMKALLSIRGGSEPASICS
jgi:hypothetical protein